MLCKLKTASKQKSIVIFVIYLFNLKKRANDRWIHKILSKYKFLLTLRFKIEEIKTFQYGVKFLSDGVDSSQCIVIKRAVTFTSVIF